jgi:hypothetical protein
MFANSGAQMEIAPNAFGEVAQDAMASAAPTSGFVPPSQFR